MTNIGDVFYINGVPHIVKVTSAQGDRIEQAEALESYIRRTRIVTYEGRKMSIDNMIQIMCDDFVRTMEDN